MSITVTMLQTRRGEDGSTWLAGQSYEATNTFAELLITANLATGDLPVVQQTSLTVAEAVAIKSLVAGGSFEVTRRLTLTPDNFGVQWISTANVTIYTGTESAGWVRHFVALSSLFGSGNAVINEGALTTFLALINFWKTRGKKLFVCLDAEPNDTLDMTPTLVRDRLLALLPRITADAQTPRFLDAVSIANEPLAKLSALYPGAEATTGVAKLAEMQRILFTLFRAYSPSTVIVSPEFQGGEGGMIAPMLAASAAGVSVLGSTGTGTRLEQFIDVIGYHPYCTSNTVALATARLTDAGSEREILSYSAWIDTAIAARRIAGDGGSAYWAGRPDPECWATEFNVSFDGGTTAANTGFRYQAFSSAQRKRLLESQLLGAFASGYSKVFLYAADHYSVQGPFVVGGSRTAEANGDLRITGDTTIRVFDGDIVQWYTTGYALLLQAVAYNASSDGYTYSLAGVPSATTFFQLQARTRGMLGGWHQEWAAVQSALTGPVETGFVAGADGDTPVPAIRINGGYMQTVVSGKRVINGAAQ